MVGMFRFYRVGLALILISTSPVLTWADDGPKPTLEPKSARGLSPFGEELPGEFVPLHPRTSEDRERIEVLRDYATARALEDRRRFSDSIELLEQALQKEPDSVAILRRLSRLNRAKGNTDRAVEYSRRVIEADPGDTETLAFLFSYYLQKSDAVGAEGLLKAVLANPKLEPSSASFLLASRQLAELYERLQEPAKAADALAKMIKALDAKVVNRLSPSELALVLGDDPARTYLAFGELFVQAKRYDLAITSFERGLASEPDHPVLPRLLAQTLLKAGRSADALTTLEPFLKGQPSGSEPYELLAEILIALKRGDEVIPRLEAAAAADPQNLSLQYALADRYRTAGRNDKAEAIYKAVTAQQPDPKGLGALAASLLKEKKTDKLIELLGNAVIQHGGFDAVHPQIESIVNDPTYADQVLAAGLTLQEAVPPKLSDSARKVLYYIATQTKNAKKLIALRRLALASEPSLSNYRELLEDLLRNEHYEEAASTLEEMLDKFPGEKGGLNLIILAQSRMMAGQFEPALAAAKDALKLDPADAQALSTIGSILVKMGRNDDAIAHFQDMLQRFPENDEMILKAHAGLSILYVSMEQFEKGEAELEALLAKYPDDPTVNNDLGYLYADRGQNLEQAEAMVRKAIEAEPENQAFLDSLGWVLFKRGKLREAVEPLEKAAQGPQADSTIHDHLGDVYFQLKEHAKARSEWEKAAQAAAKMNPPDKRLSEIQKKLGALGKLGRAPDDSTDSNP
ncbi:MAG: tetratricopeptide repeat protein [Isosphaeraceae bacterium]